MPYKIVQKGPHKWNVYRKGRPNIKPLGSHRTRREAQQQIAAIEAKERRKR